MSTTSVKVRTQDLAIPCGKNKEERLQLVSAVSLRAQTQNMYTLYLDGLDSSRRLDYARVELMSLLTSIYKGVTASARVYGYTRLAESSADFAAELALLAELMPGLQWGSDAGSGPRTWVEMIADGPVTWKDADYVFALTQISLRRMPASVEMLTELALKLDRTLLEERLEWLMYHILARDIYEHQRDN
jgi:hypothetical protein